MATLDVVTIVSLGLLTGVEFAVSVFVNPVIWMAQDETQAFLIHTFANRLGKAMPFWYIGNLVLLAAEILTRRNDVLVIAAAIVWGAVIAYTLAFLVPINNRMRKLDQRSLSAMAKAEHRRWDAGHRIRIAALTASMVLMVLSTLRH